MKDLLVGILFVVLFFAYYFMIAAGIHGICWISGMPEYAKVVLQYPGTVISLNGLSLIFAIISIYQYTVKEE
jgi:hypothetical protein